MSDLNHVADLPESTVVAEYTPAATRAEGFQSEAALEKEFIRLLRAQGYEYLPIHCEADLVANLRRQLEALNDYRFTEGEWAAFFKSIAKPGDSILEKTERLQNDYIQVLQRDDRTSKNIYLLDKKDIHNNRLQVINQYSVTQAEGARYDNRYDVTILVNGLPMVHVELKRRGVAIREAFNQINRYQRDSFWAGSGLYEYVQIFVISNGTHTKYYSNTTRSGHIREAAGRRGQQRASHSFEFTCFWADAQNKRIADLIDFTKTFLARHTLLSLLAKYCVYTTDKRLLVMRPYQIAATERILNRLRVAVNYKRAGTLEAGGYIWHTTGSGKTLTSFKTAQLASQMEGIDKVLFVVDRKDLDYQTMKEYDRFEKGAANGNTSTAVLRKQMADPAARVIITTVQKLAIFCQGHERDILKKHVVLIFDECHRSQFGDMHRAITKAFKNYYMFGFTGTPIFSANASASGHADLKTTQQAFGEQLHAYTIVDAINDGNVLPFRIDYLNTVRQDETRPDKKVQAINTEKALRAPARIKGITAYILEHFDQKTKRASFYQLKDKRVAGFNSIFAVGSIPMAKLYYEEFQRQMAETGRRLAVATIFSYNPNPEAPDGLLAEESFEAGDLERPDRDFLERAIGDYNRAFHTAFDTSADKFQNYYKDVSQRMKERDLDLLIVVDMFLTGFDATTLNTLWVDKRLRMHGLLQAFSRTNRVLNSVKTYGNIVCFRDLSQATEEALALFGDREAGGVVLLKSFEAYYHGYDENGEHHPGYTELVAELKSRFPLGREIVGEEEQKAFIRLFGAILKLLNILSSFDAFAAVQDDVLPERDRQDYQSRYIDIYQQLKKERAEKEDINDDLVFEMELIRQVEVNIDYILALVAEYHEHNCQDREILVRIGKAIDSSLGLRSKKELIEKFIAGLNAASDVREDWPKFVREEREADLAALITGESLNDGPARQFVKNAFRDGFVKTTGTDLNAIMPPLSIFDEKREAKRQGLIEKLKAFLEKYRGLLGLEA